MNLHMFLFSLIIVSWNPVTASPHARPDEGVPSFIIPDLIEGAGDAVNGIINFFQDFRISPPVSPKVPPLVNPQGANPSNTEEKQPPSSEPERSPPPPVDAIPVSTEECGPESNQNCEKGTVQNIYPLDCTNTEENTAITGELREMAPEPNGVYITEDKSCGIKIWTVKLTPTQVKTIRGRNGVRNMAPDGPIVVDNPPAADSSGEDKRTKVKKRDSIRSRIDIGKDLAFFSTPPLQETTTEFSYFASAGEGVTVYFLSRGADPSHFEFSRVVSSYSDRVSMISYWLYAKDTPMGEMDEDPDHRGSCGLSKIIGYRNGLASKAKAVVIKVVFKISSVLNGLWQMVNHLIYRRSQGEDTRGYTVLVMEYGWPDQMGANEEALEEILSILLSKYQVVVVVPTSIGSSYKSKITMVPATFYPDLPIITVGAIDTVRGGLYSWSPPGTKIVVVAPGYVQCADPYRGRSSSRQLLGAEFAGDSVSGMVAGMLANPDLGGNIRASESVPETTLRWIQTKSWAAHGSSLKRAWNGITPGQPDLWDPSIGDYFP